MMVVRLILILFVLGMLLVIFASNPPAGKAPPDGTVLYAVF